MTPAQHAFQARRLIDACGGPTAAAALCRVSAGQLSRYCDDRYKEFMNAGVMDDLQQACHAATYSEAIISSCPTGQCGDLKDDVCITVEDASAILSAVRQNGAPASPRLRDAYHRLVNAARDHLAQVDRDIDRGAV